MAPIAISTSAELALTQEYPASEFQTFARLKSSVDERKTLVTRDGNQYLALRGISTKEFERIDQRRAKLGAVRFTYFPDIQTLIIKVPSMQSEIGHNELGLMVIIRASCRMGIERMECVALGATLYQGPSGSWKEGDSSYINLNQRLRPSAGGWPCVVIQTSGSLPRPRADASWWVENSRGQVNIVLIVCIQPAIRRIQIEKYLSQPPDSRTSPRRPQGFRARLSSTIIIDAAQIPPVVTGAPLRLNFADVFDRPPNTSSEGDMVFSVADLQQYAIIVLGEHFGH